MLYAELTKSALRCAPRCSHTRNLTRNLKIGARWMGVTQRVRRRAVGGGVTLCGGGGEVVGDDTRVMRWTYQSLR
jgi:hypothetical protein